MKKQTNKTVNQETNKVSEPETAYEVVSTKANEIPEGYLPLKEGMDKVRSYVKSLYE